MGQMLNYTERIINLGIVMDGNLPWNLYVKYVNDRSSGTLIGLLYAKRLLPRNAMPKVIDSLAFSPIRVIVYQL